jgi:hypothetical protein
MADDGEPGPSAPIPAGKAPAVGERAKMKTVCVGLNSTLLEPALGDRIRALQTNVDEISFDASEILAIYAYLLVTATPAVRAEHFANAVCKAKGELFDATTVQRAFSLARFAPKPFKATKQKKKPDPHPQPLLARAAEEYFSGKLAGKREARVNSPLLDTPVLEMAAINTRVACANLLDDAKAPAQVSALRSLYDMSGKEAKLLSARLGTSRADRLARGVEAVAKNARCAAYRAREARDAAVRKKRPDEEIAALEEKLKAAMRDLETRVGTAKWQPDVALAALDASAFPARSAPRNAAAGAPAPTPLQDIFEYEVEELPETQRQDDQLLRRYELLKRVEEDTKQKPRFDLMPGASFKRRFMHITKPTARKMLGLGKGKRKLPEPCEDTLSDILPHLFKGRTLAQVKGGWHGFGDSFCTNGVEIQFKVVNAANPRARRASRRRPRPPSC